MSSKRGPIGELSDGELLNRLHAREIASLEMLYDRYSAYVHGLSLRILYNAQEAEEVTQDVFWQLWRSEARYDPERGRFSAWLFAITRSRCLDRLRSRKRRIDPEPLSPEPLSPEAIPSSTAGPEECASMEERRRRVTAALKKLPDKQRESLELCFLRGFTHQEVAEHLGEPLGTVKSRIKIGMYKLKVRLERLGIDG